MILKSIFSLTILLFSTSVYSHPGHGSADLARPKVADCADANICTKEEITAAAKKVMGFVNTGGQLNQSWSTINSPTQVTHGAVQSFSIWLATFENPLEIDPAKKFFYIVISDDGLMMGMDFNQPKMDKPVGTQKLLGLALIILLAAAFYFLVLRRLKRPSAGA